ncbi:MAG: hypothetical protein IJ205_02085 [Bacteroidales bacterium]|nr:hypothetical protein [Bacteroidales bacterium]
MVYQFRVTLAGIKGFFRVYQMDGSCTLYSFHKQMRSDMEFPQDQLIMFKALSADGSVIARYGLFDLGAGTVDKVTVQDAVEAGVASFIYFYDVPNKKSVIVTFEGTEDRPGTSPTVIETKGPNPIEFENGYVAFEDLPDSQRHLPGQKPDWGAAVGTASADSASGDDDDPDEDEEEEDDDEDGKIVFDGTEDLDF